MSPEVQMFILSIATAAMILLFFELLKLRDVTRVSDGKYQQYQVAASMQYISIKDYLINIHIAHNNTLSKYMPYIGYSIYRYLPPVVAFILLCGLIQEKYPDIAPTRFVLLCALLSLTPRDIPYLLGRKHCIRERTLAAINIVMIVVISIMVGTVSSYIDFTFIVPDLKDLINNTWGTLSVALLAIAYYKLSRLGRKSQDKQFDSHKDKVYFSGIVTDAYMALRHKYSDVVDRACNENMCSPRILYAILIYEDINRPKIIRYIENLIVKTFPVKLTVGIAQVRSDKPLSDADSIVRAAKILGGSTYADSGVEDGFSSITDLKDILHNYNSSNVYCESISRIIATLRDIDPELFYTPKIQRRDTRSNDNKDV